MPVAHTTNGWDQSAHVIPLPHRRTPDCVHPAVARQNEASYQGSGNSLSRTSQTMAPSKKTIEAHFDQNIDRIDHLLGIYDELTPDGKGRRNVGHLDLLRSAVVFLHAALEDVVRSVALWKLPLEGDTDALKSVGLPGDLESNQFHLGHVAYHRGKTVDELLEAAVDDYLEESNFNKPGDIEEMLERCNLDSSFLRDHKSQLHPMMKRRHWIVHRMDRSYDAGPGHHSARSIQKSTVEAWKQAVQDVVDEILEQV